MKHVFYEGEIEDINAKPKEVKSKAAGEKWSKDESESLVSGEREEEKEWVVWGSGVKWVKEEK